MEQSQFRIWLKQHEIEHEEKWLEQFISACNGDEQAMVNTALLYKEYGQYDEMYGLLCKASEQQNREAMYELGNCYFEELGEKGSEQQAFLLYKSAAHLGHPDAMNNLADMYLNGEGTAVDEQQALSWFKMAAQFGIAEAMFTLGIMYEQGLGTECDESQAFAYYSRSAEKQDEEAMYRMGMIYFSGELGQQQDNEKALDWFLKASGQFHVDATFNIGYCYENGHGVARNNEKAIHYYKKASLLGDMEATKKVVRYYEQRDIAEAAKWQEKLKVLNNDIYE